MGRTAPSLHPDAERQLQQYAFPGNVRELRNMMEHAMLRSRDDVITTRHIHFLADSPATPGTAAGHASTTDPDVLILAYLRRNECITNEQARQVLGISQRRVTYVLGKLVESGVLTRQGERRWTTYALAMDTPTQL
jgi:transcriptional regulator with PAS, ATPase and Fis domain